jgi:hypothetical protein
LITGADYSESELVSYSKIFNRSNTSTVSDGIAAKIRIRVRKPAQNLSAAAEGND